MSDNAEPRNTVTLTVDGQEIQVPRGITVLEAAQQVGVTVPHFCYHPGLSSPAMCRLCLVEVEGAPKLQPSCVTMAQDGQVVRTDSPGALEMRRGVLEFYLVNHPLDCPICDQSGECKLQDYVFEEGRKHGRSHEPKRVFGRDDFGGDVLFYGDRCVMCTRCVRFMDEVAGDPRLTVVERGDRSIIDTFFEEGLSGSPFAGNIVDICPVGALVSKDFLHKARAWDLDQTPSICTSCSQGCNIQLHTRDNQVQRMKPRENMEVNGFWLCEYGRHNYEWMNRGDRVEIPRVRSDPDGLSAAGWGEALDFLLPRLREGGEVMAVASPFACNEDLGALVELVDALGGGELLFRSAEAAEEIVLPGFPQMARRRDLSPNRTGAERMGFRRVGDHEGRGGLEEVAGHTGILLVLGDELHDQDGSFGAHASLRVHLGAGASAVSETGDAVLPLTTHAEQEGSFTNLTGRVQRFWPALRPPGAARPAWMILGALAAHLRAVEPPASAGEAFQRFVVRHAAFEGLSFEMLGTAGSPTHDPVPLAGD